MKSYPTKKIILLAAATLAVATATISARATVIYTSEFINNSTGSGNSIAYSGWTGYYGHTDATKFVDANQNGFGQTKTGYGTNITDHKQATADNGGSKGYLWLKVERSSYSYGKAATLQKTGLNLALMKDSIIEWDMVASYQSTSVRVMVEVGGQWYASNAQFLTTSDNKATSFVTTLNPDNYHYSFNFTTDKSAWRSVTINQGGLKDTDDTSIAGSGIVLSSSTLAQDLSSSTITGIGFYVSHGQGFSVEAAFDSLVISNPNVPEPSTYALIAGAVIFLGVFILRRRNA